jgi:hypothetical protein
MTTLVSSAAHAAAKSLSTSGHTLKRSHLSEVVAAMLGYQTYAALSVEEQDSSLKYHLDDAEMYVLDLPAGEQRARALGLSAPSAVVKACGNALRDAAPHASVYDGVSDFYDSYAREALEDTISSSDEVANAMAETNAYFGESPELPIEAPYTENLWEARTDWSIEAQGDMNGSHDFDSDRMYAGDTLNCNGKLTFSKAGRAGLIAEASEASGGVDHEWQMQDRDDEAAYMAQRGAV